MEQTKHAIWNKGFTLAFLANLLLCFSQGTVNTLISTYASWLGASAVLVGTISGLYFGVAFAARPFSGPAITILDKKKIMLATYALGVITNVAYAVAGNVQWFLLARVLHGLQFAFVGSLNLTIASDSLPREKLGSGIGVFGIGAALASAFGPSLGIAVRDWGSGLWGVRGGYTAVFLLAALFMLLGIVPCAAMPRQPGVDRAALGKWYRNILATQTLLPTMLLLLVSAGSILYTSYMVPYADELGISGIGLFFTIYAVFLLVARPVSGRLSDRWGLEKVLVPGFLIFALSFLVVGLGRSKWVLLVGAALYALGYGAVSPAIQTLCIRTVEPERRGVASNTQYFGMDLGYFLGPLLGSLLYDKLGYSNMYLLGGIVPQLLALAIFLLTWRRLKKRLY